MLSGHNPKIDNQVQIHVNPINLVDDDRQGNESLENLLNELSGVLEVEIDQYQECMNLLNEQQEKIIAGDSDAIEEIGKKEDTIILKIKTLEEARKSIVLQLAQYLKISVRELNLARLAILTENPYSERYTAYRRQILYIIRNLESLRGSNTYLIHNALHYINGILKIFASVHTIGASYSKKGLLKFSSESGKNISGLS